MNKDGDKVDGVVYLNMDRGGCHRRYLMDEMYIENLKCYQMNQKLCWLCKT